MSAQVEFYSYIILSRIIVCYKKTWLIFQVKMCETTYFMHLGRLTPVLMHSIINRINFLYYTLYYMYVCICVYVCVHIYMCIYMREIFISLFLSSCGTHRACIEAIIHKRHINILQINTKKKDIAIWHSLVPMIKRNTLWTRSTFRQCSDRNLTHKSA